ncbi:transcription factor HES-5-like [Xenopus tropicalis]|uniref:Transcription factor HES-5 n=1 Tax=Xenopus tropicalis TaxID=8364 RepID=A0A803K458_XENTR|nr:transcription factor HES-5-like [Xenopus tropicalis]
MAPYSATNILTTEHNHKAQGIRKMRKPVVEKMRRDRINSSIEQLRMLLEKEFESHHLPSKPEKADILEMAVSFLQQHMATKYAQSSLVQIEGHSKYHQDSLQFVSPKNQSEFPEKLLHNFYEDHSVAVSPPLSPLYQTPTKCTTPGPSKVIWRPF